MASVRLERTSVAHRPVGSTTPAGGRIGTLGPQRLALDSLALARRTGLYLPANLPFTTWQRIGAQISTICDSSAWWLGDWLLYGQLQYADRYRKAILETSLDYQTLRNYTWVARRFPMSRRRDKLSFQHHAEVASLPEAQQDLWLDRAEVFGWSRNELRRRLRACRSRDCDQALITVSVRVNVAPDRERRWQEAARQTNCNFEEWMRLVLDEAANSVLEDEASG
jgi:hypothetical protein